MSLESERSNSLITGNALYTNRVETTSTHLSPGQAVLKFLAFFTWSCPGLNNLTFATGSAS